MYFLDIYVQRKSHLYRALAQRKDTPKYLTATRKEIGKIVHSHVSAVTPVRDRQRQPSLVNNNCIYNIIMKNKPQ